MTDYVPLRGTYQLIENTKKYLVRLEEMGISTEIMEERLNTFSKELSQANFTSPEEEIAYCIEEHNTLFTPLNKLLQSINYLQKDMIYDSFKYSDLVRNSKPIPAKLIVTDAQLTASENNQVTEKLNINYGENEIDHQVSISEADSKPSIKIGANPFDETEPVEIKPLPHQEHESGLSDQEIQNIVQKMNFDSPQPSKEKFLSQEQLDNLLDAADAVDVTDNNKPFPPWDVPERMVFTKAPKGFVHPFNDSLEQNKGKVPSKQEQDEFNEKLTNYQNCGFIDPVDAEDYYSRFIVGALDLDGLIEIGERNIATQQELRNQETIKDQKLIQAVQNPDGFTQLIDGQTAANQLTLSLANDHLVKYQIVTDMMEPETLEYLEDKILDGTYSYEDIKSLLIRTAHNYLQKAFKPMGFPDIVDKDPKDTEQCFIDRMDHYVNLIKETQIPGRAEPVPEPPAPFPPAPTKVVEQVEDIEILPAVIPEDQETKPVEFESGNPLDKLILSDHQQEVFNNAINGVFSFINRRNSYGRDPNEPQIHYMGQLIGPAGSGKTTLMAKVLERTLQEGYSVCFCSPTHKALAVIRDILADFQFDFVENNQDYMERCMYDRDGSATNKIVIKTLASFLGLKMDRDLENGKESFQRSKHHQQIQADVLFLDEASMVSAKQFAFILKILGIDVKAILFIGDDVQLTSPEDKKDQPNVIFQLPNKYELTEVVRQAKMEDGSLHPITQLAWFIRSCILNRQFPNPYELFPFDDKLQESWKPYLKVTSDQNEFVTMYLKDVNDSQNKLVSSFTNKMVDEYNEYIRGLIFTGFANHENPFNWQLENKETSDNYEPEMYRLLGTLRFDGDVEVHEDFVIPNEEVYQEYAGLTVKPLGQSSGDLDSAGDSALKIDFSRIGKPKDNLVIVPQDELPKYQMAPDHQIDVKPFYIGEKIILRETNQRGSTVVHQNGMIVKLQSVIPKIHKVDIVKPKDGDAFASYQKYTVQLKYWELTDTEFKKINVIDKNFELVYKDCIKALADEAERSTAKRRWAKYHNLKGTFTKVGYLYSSTVHKLQGSTTNHLYFDARDTLKITPGSMYRRDPLNLFKLLYVAVTRPKHKLIVLK